MAPFVMLRNQAKFCLCVNRTSLGMEVPNWAVKDSLETFCFTQKKSGKCTGDKSSLAFNSVNNRGVAACFWE